MMLPRAKSVGANLVLAAFCLLWPVFIASGSLLFGIFLGFGLWPLGLFYLFKALTLHTEPEFLPRPPKPPVVVEVPRGPDVRANNREAALRWVNEVHPGWSRSSQLGFASVLVQHFGTRPWDGSNENEIFAEAVDFYTREQLRNPTVFVDFTAINRRDSLGSHHLKARFDQAPDTEQSQRLRATIRFEEVGFVVVERPDSPANLIILNELFVTPGHRGRGVGTAILRTVEDLAWKEGRARVLLEPRQLDPGSLTTDQLRLWYKKRGYAESSLREGALEKT